MNFILRIIIIGLSAFYIVESFPWWVIIILPFILGISFDDNLISHFLSSFIGTSVAWIFLLLDLDLGSQSILSIKIIEILSIESTNSLIIITSIIAGVISGMGNLTGISLRNILFKKKKIREYRF